MMQIWMPLILAGFCGFMVATSLQQLTAAISRRPYDRKHALFALWAILVALQTATIALQYVTLFDAWAVTILQLQAMLSVLILAMWLKLTQVFLDVSPQRFFSYLLGFHLLLLLSMLPTPYGGFVEHFSDFYRRPDGLMAGRLDARDLVLGWRAQVFNLLFIVDCLIALSLCLQRLWRGERDSRVVFYLWAVLFYGGCYVADIALYVSRGEMANLALIGVGSIAFYMGGLLSTAERERFYLDSHRAMNDRVQARTAELEATMQKLSQQVAQTEALQRQLAQAQKMETVGRLAGGIAHDFNNALSAIRGYGELACDLAEPGSEQQEYLGQVIEAADRSAEVVGKLLGFARRQRSYVQYFPLDVLMERSLALLADRLAQAHVTVHRSYALRGTGEPDEAMLIAIDADHFAQVIGYIVDNAVDAMPQGGELSVAVRYCKDGSANLPSYIRDGDYARLTMTDTGYGMDESVLKHIFEPFFSTKPPEQGAGLGMAVCYGLLKQNNAYITVDSAVGRGTSVDIYFPLVKPDSTALVASVAIDKPEVSVDTRLDVQKLAGGGRILIVEDDDMVRNLNRSLLGSFGYEVLTAANGTEALAMLRGSPVSIDLILTDLMMPQMNGDELVRILRTDPDFERVRDVSVICLSGYADEPALQEMRGLDVCLLQKPYAPNELLQAIKSLLAGSRRRGA